MGIFTEIPLKEALSVSYGIKTQVFDLCLGDSISDFKKELNKRGVLFRCTNREVQVDTALFDLPSNNTYLKLAVGFDESEKISYFYFYQSEKCAPFSLILAELSLLLQNTYEPLKLIKYNIDYKRDTTFRDHKHLEAWYKSYYEVIHLMKSYCDVSMSIISMEEYERINTPKWKSFIKRIKSRIMHNEHL